MSNQIRELEKRIETLEQEVHLLTAQIKFTLLEIQERLLNDTHPALQSTELEISSNRFSSPSVQPTPSTQSQVRQVMLNTAAEEGTPPPQPKPVAVPAQDMLENTMALDRLENWVWKKVKQIGAVRTRRLIDVYYHNGQLSQAVATTLLQLVNNYTDEPPITPKVNKSQHLPARHSAQALPTQDVTEQGAPRKRTPPATRLPEEHSHDQPQNMILRLIAGVQSAGIGITRRKPRG